MYSVFNRASSKRKRQLTESETALLEQKDDKVKPDSSVPKRSTSAAVKQVRTFQEEWLHDFDWLRYDSQKKLMACVFCVEKPHISGKTDRRTEAVIVRYVMATL